MSDFVSPMRIFTVPNDEVVEPSAIARTPAFSQAPHEDHEITTFLGLGASPEILRPLSSSTQKTKSPSLGGHSRIQNIALKRLYNDLKLSVPVVLILSIYCLVSISSASLLALGESWV